MPPDPQHADPQHADGQRAIEQHALEGDWQSLPARARKVFILNDLLLVIPFAAAPAILGGVFDLSALSLVAAVSCGALLGAAFGVWLGNKHWKYTHWRLDADGFSLRRGRLWRSETRVPQSRVQHLDLKRGPLQRHYGLSTLVIHTAGTRHSAVTVSCLEEADAEALRDQLARQLHDDDDDDDA